MREGRGAGETPGTEVGRRVGEAYRRPVTPGPGARERLIERLARVPPPRARRTLWARMTGGDAPAPLRFAMAAAVVLVVGGTIIGRSLDREAGAPGVASQRPAAPSDAPMVRFELTAPEAARVTLVGDFNGWDRQATPMRRSGTPGGWTVSLPLERGRHAYGFVVDGERWVADPLAPLAPADGFGGVNSIVVVNGPGAS